MNRRAFFGLAPVFPVAAVSAALVLREEGKPAVELDVRVLKLEPGDTLVLQSDSYISEQTAARLKDIVEAQFAGVKVLLFDRTVKLEGVLRGPA